MKRTDRRPNDFRELNQNLTDRLELQIERWTKFEADCDQQFRITGNPAWATRAKGVGRCRQNVIFILAKNRHATESLEKRLKPTEPKGKS